MGGNSHSKPKNGASSSSSVILPQDIAKSTSVKSLIDLLLISMPNTPIELILLILGYGTPLLLTASPNPKQFFVSIPRCTLFYDHVYFNLSKADQHCIWGRPEELIKTIEEVKELDEVRSKSAKDRDSLLPRLLTTDIDGEDHRGPGFIPSGTLLERVLYVEDVLNEDEKSGETMAAMLGRIVRETCGEEEFKKQVTRAQKVIEEESKKKAAIEADDIKALNKVWNVLKNADEKTLKSNAELKIALAEFDNQLRKLGNENIIKEAEKLCDFADFGGYISLKNNFAKNRIIGLAQLMRLSVCDLQICFPGLYYSLNRLDGKVIAKRIDVRQELGVLSSGVATYSLGSNCHLDIYGDRGLGTGVIGVAENLSRAKAARYKKFCSDWTIHPTSRLRL